MNKLLNQFPLLSPFAEKIHFSLKLKKSQIIIVLSMKAINFLKLRNKKKRPRSWQLEEAGLCKGQEECLTGAEVASEAGDLAALLLNREVKREGVMERAEDMA